MSRTERWILVLCVSGLILIGVESSAGIRLLAAAGSVLSGVGGALSALESQRKGVIWTNLGRYRPEECRACFRFQLAWLWTFILLWTFGGVLYGLGVLGHR